MADRRIVIFANPIAGRGRGGLIAQRLKTELLQRGYAPLIWDRPPDDLAAETLSPAPEAVIAIGGDGTLRGAAERLWAAFGAAPWPPILTVPLGTANLMGRHLGLRWTEPRIERQIVDAIERRRIRSIDGGMANGKLFLLMVGVGFDAQVVHSLAAVRKGPIRMHSYLLPAAQSLLKYQYASITVELDGHAAFGPTPAVAFVGNVAEYGGGISLLPEAKSDDGLLDVCILPSRSPVELARWLVEAAVGTHFRHPDALYRRAKRVAIASEPSLPVQIDGDPAGFTPLNIQLLPVQVPFIVGGEKNRREEEQVSR